MVVEPKTKYLRLPNNRARYFSDLKFNQMVTFSRFSINDHDINYGHDDFTIGLLRDTTPQVKRQLLIFATDLIFTTFFPHQKSNVG